VTPSLYVETAPYPQDIACPDCGHEFDMLIEDEKIAGCLCPGCTAEIRFRHERQTSERVVDETEQNSLDAWS